MPTQAPRHPARGVVAPPRPRPATPGGSQPACAPTVGPLTPARPHHDHRGWSDRDAIALPWEQRATVRQRHPRSLRLPAPGDPAPATGRMLGVCAWAVLLALVGLAVAGRAMVALFAGGTPPWYEPTLVLGGMVGIGLTAAAFLAMHHPRLPWVLLTAATAPLVVNMVGTSVAL